MDDFPESYDREEVKECRGAAQAPPAAAWGEGVPQPCSKQKHSWQLSPGSSRGCGSATSGGPCRYSECKKITVEKGKNSGSRKESDRELLGGDESLSRRDWEDSGEQCGLPPPALSTVATPTIKK